MNRYTHLAEEYWRQSQLNKGLDCTWRFHNSGTFINPIEQNTIMTTEHDVKCRIEAAESELTKAKEALKDITRGYKHAVTGRILSALSYWHPHLDEEGTISIYITLKCVDNHRFRAAGSFTDIARKEGWCIGCCDAVGDNDMQIRLFPINRT